MADNTQGLITTKQTKHRPVASAAKHPITPNKAQASRFCSTASHYSSGGGGGKHGKFKNQYSSLKFRFTLPPPHGNSPEQSVKQVGFVIGSEGCSQPPPHPFRRWPCRDRGSSGGSETERVSNRDRIFNCNPVLKLQKIVIQSRIVGVRVKEKCGPIFAPPPPRCRSAPGSLENPTQQVSKEKNDEDHQNRSNWEKKLHEELKN